MRAAQDARHIQLLKIWQVRAGIKVNRHALRVCVLKGGQHGRAQALLLQAVAPRHQGCAAVNGGQPVRLQRKLRPRSMGKHKHILRAGIHEHVDNGGSAAGLHAHCSGGNAGFCQQLQHHWADRVRANHAKRGHLQAEARRCNHKVAGAARLHAGAGHLLMPARHNREGHRRADHINADVAN